MTSHYEARLALKVSPYFPEDITTLVVSYVQADHGPICRNVLKHVHNGILIQGRFTCHHCLRKGCEWDKIGDRKMGKCVKCGIMICPDCVCTITEFQHEYLNRMLLTRWYDYETQDDPLKTVFCPDCYPVKEKSEFLQILEKYHDQIEEWELIYHRSEITLDFVLAHRDYPWDFSYLSQNVNITLEMLLNVDLPWCFYSACSNPNIALSMVREHFPHILEKKNLYRHKDEEDEATSIMLLMENPSLKKDDVLWLMKEYSLDPNSDENLFWTIYEHLPLQDILDLGIPINYRWLSYNTTLTPEFVLKNLDKDWNWSSFLSRKGFGYKFFKTNPGVQTIYQEELKNVIARIKKDNPEFTGTPWEIYYHWHRSIDKNPYDPPNGRSFYYHGYSRNPTLSLHKLRRYMDKLQIFDWTAITASPRFTLKDIMNNPEFPWDLEYYQLNPNLTLEELETLLKKGIKLNHALLLRNTYRPYVDQSRWERYQ